MIYRKILKFDTKDDCTKALANLKVGFNGSRLDDTSFEVWCSDAFLRPEFRKGQADIDGWVHSKNPAAIKNAVKLLSHPNSQLKIGSIKDASGNIIEEG